MYNNLKELNASLARVYESMQDRRWSVTYTDRRGERRTVSAKDEQDAKRVAQEFKGKGMKGIAVNASDAQNETYFNQDHRAVRAIVKEAAGRNLEGTALSAALTATCMSHWYDLISTFTSRTDVYDVHPIQKKNGFKILRMTPGHDVKDQAYESVVRTSTSLTASLNKLFGKDVFEPRVQRADGNLETLVAFKDSAGGVFQCKAKVTGGDTEIFLTIPEESELDTAFNSMLGLAGGAENELAGPDDASPVAGDPAPEFDPSAEDDIEPNTDIANLKEPEIDLEDDDGDFRNLPAHPDQRIESVQPQGGTTELDINKEYVGRIQVGANKAYEKPANFANILLSQRHHPEFLSHPDKQAATRRPGIAVSLTRLEELLGQGRSAQGKLIKFTVDPDNAKTREDGSKFYTNILTAEFESELKESKQPPKEAKAYKNGYITGQESSKGDVASATIPDNYRGSEHEAKWKQGFRDGFKNKPVKESRMIGAKDTAHWTTDEYGKRVPKIGSYWFLNGDGGDDVYVITGVHDGAVYTQNTRTLKTQWTKLKFWEQYATPANSKEDAGLNHAEKQVSRAVKKDVGIERVARRHAEKQIRQDIGEEASAPASANSVGASKIAGHATAHAPDAVGVKKKVLRRKPKSTK